MKKTSKIALASVLIIALAFSLSSCIFLPFGPDPEPGEWAPTHVESAAGIKNVILIIGDGMGDAQLDAGELVYEKEFAFRDELKYFHSNTNSLNSLGLPLEVTDSAASATALATGRLTENKYVGMDPDGEHLVTVLDIAAGLGKATGVVTNDSLTGATPAGFTAHVSNRNLSHDIVRSQATSEVDLLIGQYDSIYEAHLSDIEPNYRYFGSYDKDAILSATEAQLLCQFDIEGESDNSIALKDAAELAIERLSADEDGFVLVIEQARIDKRCHDKDFDGAAFYANSLNDTVEAVRNFAKDRNDTAIIITADHETGGLSVSSDAEKYSKTHTTVNGNVISYKFKGSSHTDTFVPVYIEGFELYPAVLTALDKEDLIKNSDIYYIVRDLSHFSAMKEE